MTNWVKTSTDLLFNAYVGIHQVRILVFDNYQRCPLPLTTIQRVIFDKNKPLRKCRIISKQPAEIDSPLVPVFRWCSSHGVTHNKIFQWHSDLNCPIRIWRKEKNTGAILVWLVKNSQLKGSRHYWYLLKIIIIIKPDLVTSNGETREVDSIKHCEKRPPLK